MWPFNRTIIEIEQPKECYKCKHLFSSWGREKVVDSEKVWFCSEHIPVWDEMFLDYVGLWSTRHAIYYKKFAVSEDGTPIGYKKIEGKDESESKQKLVSCGKCKKQMPNGKWKSCIHCRRKGRKYYHKKEQE